jgi:D-glycerate 3-kinase
VLECNRSDQRLELPIFDKSQNGGKGDRSSSTVSIETPIDVFILEGWSMGFQPLGEDNLTRRYQAALSSQESTHPNHLKPAFLSHSLQSLLHVDDYLSAASKILYPSFSLLIQIRPESYTYVYDWRRQQEHHMIATRGTGMSDAEVDAFVGRYMPGYELWSGSRWKGNSLTLMYGKDREVLAVELV